MRNRAWLERLVLYLAAHSATPVRLTSQKGASYHIRDVRHDGDRITIYIEPDK